MLASRDNINYVRHKFQRALRSLDDRRPAVHPGLAPDPVQRSVRLRVRLSASIPTASRCARRKALREIVLNEVDPSKLDTNLYCFERFDANDKVDDTTTAYLVDSLGHEVIGRDPQGVSRTLSRGLHRSRFARMARGGWPYYEYEYAIDGLQLAEPVFLAVTAFDFGNPAADLSSLESSPTGQCHGDLADQFGRGGEDRTAQTGRVSQSVSAGRRLQRNRLGESARISSPIAERARKVTFTNVPDTCTISIWSLDGDLVRQLDHAEHPVELGGLRGGVESDLREHAGREDRHLHLHDREPVRHRHRQARHREVTGSRGPKVGSGSTFHDVESDSSWLIIPERRV